MDIQISLHRIVCPLGESCMFSDQFVSEKISDRFAKDFPYIFDPLLRDGPIIHSGIVIQSLYCIRLRKHANVRINVYELCR